MNFGNNKITKALTSFTVGAFPSLYADFVSIFVACVMSKDVVPGSTELCTSRVVIMVGALDPHLISQVSVLPVMIESVPFWSRQDNSAVTRFLDDAGARFVSRLQNQRKLPLK